MQKTNSVIHRILPVFLLLASGSLTHASDKPPDQMSIIETILHGGPLIVMIWLCILGTSMILVTFTIQLFMTLRGENLAPKALMESLKSTVEAGNYQEAWETCKANKAYVAKVLQGALERLGRGQDAVQGALIEYGLRQSQPIKTKISYISVIGVIAPMIGLLGTVIGMMGAFAVLGSSGVADPRGLALRIGEVLMATASGLFIAIPAFIFYYYFRNLATIMVGLSDDKLQHLMVDVPYEELHGIIIGDGADGSFTPQAAASGASQNIAAAAEANCPVCNGGISVGETPCPHCGSPIDWGT
ncbi:MAG: MotA/TolQ/ExbB proton channel family protein [Verrucomicrobia bacterium]|jgi:biopolymer transport protein ExbB|nr:MotA/TolQ/ExbB proton channel family protein [Verrucomicrobiota bacterium]